MPFNDTDDNVPAGTLDDMFAVATRTANRGSDLAVAAGQVIAKRVALGMAAGRSSPGRRP